MSVRREPADGRIAAVVMRGRSRSAVISALAAVLQFVVAHPASLMTPAFILWGATHLDGFSWDYDEGAHVVAAWLAQLGHPLYAQTVSAYTPGYLVTLIAAFDLLGLTMAVARLTTVLYAALGLGAVMVGARALANSAEERWLSQVAAIAAGSLLVVTPFFVQWSRAAMSDLPSEAITALSVAFAMIYVRDMRARWLFASVFVLACALWIKATAAGGAATVGLAALWVLLNRRQDIARALLGLLIIGGLAALPLLAFDLPKLYEQAIYFHVQKRTAYPLDVNANLITLFNFLAQNLTLTVFAFYGLLRAWRTPAVRVLAAVTTLWFAATWMSLVLQTPLFNHHSVILVFALALAGGCGVMWVVDDARLLLRRRTPPVVVSGAVVLLIAIAGLPQYPTQLADAAAPAFQPAAEEAVALLQAVTPPGDLLVTDGQVIAFRAQRQPPAALADTSTARLASGNLTGAQLIEITQQSDANGILFWGGRIESAVQFAAWATQNYRLVRSSFQKPNAPYRLLLREAHPQTPLSAQFGDGIALLGYDLNRRTGQAVRAAEPISLTLYLQRTGPINASYTVFVHALDDDGKLIAQDDRLPLNDRYTTNQWRSDEFIIDEFAMQLPADLVTAVQIELGFYDRVTLKRLAVAVNGARQPGDRLLLPPLQVAR